MHPVTREQRDEAIAHFKYEGTLIKDCPYGSGHINDTYLLVFDIADMGRIKVILQRMNSTAFPKPVEVMENIMGVTSFLKKKIIENNRKNVFSIWENSSSKIISNMGGIITQTYRKRKNKKTI